MKIDKTALAALAGVVLMGPMTSALAEVWGFHGSTVTGSGFKEATGTGGVAGVTGTATAWANTGDTNLVNRAYLTNQGDSGLGVKNNDCGTSNGCSQSGDSGEGVPPEHAIDSQERLDSVLFSFAGDKVNLSSVTFGWSTSDVDFSVYAYTGVADATTALDAGSHAAGSDLVATGWTLISQYEYVGSAFADTSVDKNIDFVKVAGTGNIYSSYWLIGAGNSLGNNDYCSNYKNGTCKSYGEKADYFKLLAVAGTAYCKDNDCGGGGGGGGGGGQIPEPGTLLLLGTGLLGMTRIARRPAR